MKNTLEQRIQNAPECEYRFFGKLSQKQVCSYFHVPCPEDPKDRKSWRCPKPEGEKK